MKMGHYQQLAMLVSLFAVSQNVFADSQLSIGADTPEITIQPRANNSGFMHLPNLTYVFDIDAQCARELQPISLLISVADTRKTISTNEIMDEALTLTLEIPADQIAPIAIRDFCVADTSSNARNDSDLVESGARKLPAVLSAQASMRCGAVAEDPELDVQTPQVETLYASTPLDVMLTCEHPVPSADSPIR